MVTFSHSGAAALQSALVGLPGLACTSGTGVLPLCAQAAATWQQVEQNTVGPSTIAAASVRAMAATMITCILAEVGGNRWCETITAPASAATFARLFPQARFVCFYRGCPGVVSAATEAARWGLGRAGLGDFAPWYPGDSVAAAGAFWCARTSALLDFEAAHSSRCLRVRYEDLATSPTPAIRSVLDFLGLVGPATPGVAPRLSSGQQVPAGLIPGPMLDQINRLHQRLGYPAMTESSPGGSPERRGWLATPAGDRAASDAQQLLQELAGVAALHPGRRARGLGFESP